AVTLAALWLGPGNRSGLRTGTVGPVGAGVALPAAVVASQIKPPETVLPAPPVASVTAPQRIDVAPTVRPPPSPGPRPIMPAGKAGVLGWSGPGPRTPGADQADCAAATAALLVDNSAENRRQRERTCAPGRAGAARAR
ncbi:MAG TPA: hypothetical protein VES73_12790, partial [Lamprocystis sp. (in: g-proteobacteria)]|nr:hypothetical protein [Lamprocystis sp. (in: g-proteobacteria)]